MEFDDTSPAAIEAIERTRKLTRDLAAKVTEHGVEPIDAAIGIAFGLHDFGLQLMGHPAAMVEWLRSACDLFERGHLESGVGAIRHVPRRDGDEG